MENSFFELKCESIPPHLNQRTGKPRKNPSEWYIRSDIDFFVTGSEEDESNSIRIPFDKDGLREILQELDWCQNTFDEHDFKVAGMTLYGSFRPSALFGPEDGMMNEPNTPS